MVLFRFRLQVQTERQAELNKVKFVLEYDKVVQVQAEG